LETLIYTPCKVKRVIGDIGCGGLGKQQMSMFPGCTQIDCLSSIVEEGKVMICHKKFEIKIEEKNYKKVGKCFLPFVNHDSKRSHLS
jgi:hypothetical protein